MILKTDGSVDDSIISDDGLVTKRYVLSDFKAGNISYDEQTHMCTMEGIFKMSTVVSL